MARLTQVGLPDRLPGRLHAAWIAGKHPSVIDRQSCRATRWGTPPGHMPGVRFATREPAPVIQLVVQSHCRDQYELAEQNFDYALKHCHKSSVANKKRILNYLVPVKLLRGRLPTNKCEYVCNCPRIKTYIACR